ncbi:hypothetical protein FQA39_LY04997 [Lamprigera yunnana]|nr:hypothetical protein FQA39_LY04997 [Lamprigera yunnana]
MVYLNEKYRIQILIMVGFGDQMRTHAKTCQLFNTENPNHTPISGLTVRKILAKFAATGSVGDRARQNRPIAKEDTKLNILLEVQDNPTFQQGTLPGIMQSAVPQSKVVTTTSSSECINGFKAKVGFDKSGLEWLVRMAQVINNVRIDLSNGIAMFRNIITVSQEKIFRLNEG